LQLRCPRMRVPHAPQAVAHLLESRVPLLLVITRPRVLLRWRRAAAGRRSTRGCRPQVRQQQGDQLLQLTQRSGLQHALTVSSGIFCTVALVLLSHSAIAAALGLPATLLSEAVAAADERAQASAVVYCGWLRGAVAAWQWHTSHR
jgi:hypothetical protein